MLFTWSQVTARLRDSSKAPQTQRVSSLGSITKCSYFIIYRVLQEIDINLCYSTWWLYRYGCEFKCIFKTSIFGVIIWYVNLLVRLATRYVLIIGNNIIPGYNDSSWKTFDYLEFPRLWTLYYRAWTTQRAHKTRFNNNRSSECIIFDCVFLWMQAR